MFQDLAFLSPLVIVTLVGLLVLIVGVFAPRDSFRGWLGYLTAMGFASALLALWWLWGQLPVTFNEPFFASAISLDGFGVALTGVILIGALLTTLSAVHYLPQQNADHPEYYTLVSFATLGMMSMVLAADLLTLFVGVECMSLAIYVLAGFKRQSPFSTEAAMKYFILGSFASAILLLGIAFTYGATGTISMAEIGRALGPDAGEPALTFGRIGLLLMLAAFAFKIAAAPFHMWTPDVYEGSPSSVGGLMAVAVKTASFGALARVLVTCFGADIFREGNWSWEGIVAGLAVISMFTGNLLALNQRNLKRMLAYSAIAHTGYIMIALVTTAPGGPSAITPLGGGLIFYLLAYTLANAAAFGVAAAVSGDDHEDVGDAAYRGLARKHPALGFVLTIAMLSLLGIPLTAGFAGKLTIFTEALDAPGEEHLWLIIVAALNSVLSAFYYIRVLVVAYMREPDSEIRVYASGALRWSLGIAVALTLFIGLLPTKAIDLSRAAGYSLANRNAPLMMRKSATVPPSETVDTAAIAPR